MQFKPGQRVVYRKAGLRPCWDTEWAAIYVRETKTHLHVIKVIGARYVKTVRRDALRASDS